MYADAVPSMVAQTKNALVQSNLNYQKDLNEVAVIVAKNLAGREKEIGDGMAPIYAAEFTEAGIEGPRDLLQIAARPEIDRGGAAGDERQHGLHAEVGGGLFCRDQRPVPRRDEKARQGNLIWRMPRLGEVDARESGEGESIEAEARLTIRHSRFAFAATRGARENRHEG